MKNKKWQTINGAMRSNCGILLQRSLFYTYLFIISLLERLFFLKTWFCTFPRCLKVSMKRSRHVLKSNLVSV